MPLTEQTFREHLALGHESRGVEFKGPGMRSDRHLLARVARAVIGMANRRDGGLVIVGIEDVEGTPTECGLNEDELASWKYEDVAAAIGEYTDPSVSFELEVLTSDGRHYACLHVHEFEEWPILCAKSYQGDRGQDVLRRGALYLRGRRRVETAEIPSLEEMRELLELAAEKRLRQFLATARRVGIESGQSADDADQFQRQLGELG